jgi:hypothetical protein
MGIARRRCSRLCSGLTDCSTAALGSFPSSGFGGAENRFYDGHIADGIFEGNRDVAIATDGPRKNVSLNGVLITGGEGFRGHAAGVDIAPVIDENSARTIVRRVKGDFDFDASFGAEDLHALVRDELRAACENGLAGGKIEDHGSEPVRAEFRVSFD